MHTYKITVYKNNQYIRDIFADFETLKQAQKWTIQAYKSIGVSLSKKEIVIRRIMDN